MHNQKEKVKQPISFFVLTDKGKLPSLIVLSWLGSL